jgi:CBS domain containing-hemolysin-like protein
VLRVQEHPGPYFTVVQIGLNAVAILGGIVGEGAWSPYFVQFFLLWLSPAAAQTAAFIASFLATISLFLVFADLFPKRLGMTNPEQLAMRMVGPMQALTTLLKPVVWLFSKSTDGLFRLLGLPAQRDEKVTSADILALTEAGAQAGVLARREQQVIANVFELDTRTVSSAMTPRERIAWFRRDDPDAVVRARIAAEPFSTYPVCDGDIDHVRGLCGRQGPVPARAEQPADPADRRGLLHKALIVPDRLTLAEVLEQFRQAHEDFAVIVNEYSLVVGVVTLNDVMSTVMGELVSPPDEEQIVQRDENSWLIDGVTPITDVLRALRAGRPAPQRGVRNPGGLPDGDAAPRAEADRQGQLGRLHLRGAGRGQLPHRPGHGHADRRLAVEFPGPSARPARRWGTAPCPGCRCSGPAP